MTKVIHVYYVALLLITCFLPISASSPNDSANITEKYRAEGKTHIASSTDSPSKAIDSIPITDNSKLTAGEIKSEVVKYRRMFGWGCVLTGTGAVMTTALAYDVLKEWVGIPLYFESYLIIGFLGIISTGSIAGGTVMISLGHKRAKRYSQLLSVGIELSGPQITFSLYKH
jgi:hypothetical protein